MQPGGMSAAIVVPMRWTLRSSAATKVSMNFAASFGPADSNASKVPFTRLSTAAMLECACTRRWMSSRMNCSWASKLPPSRPLKC